MKALNIKKYKKTCLIYLTEIITNCSVTLPNKKSSTKSAKIARKKYPDRRNFLIFQMIFLERKLEKIKISPNFGALKYPKIPDDIPRRSEKLNYSFF